MNRLWIAGLGFGLTLACNNGDDASGSGCLENQTVFCACPGDAPTSPSGTQICLPGGQGFAPCMCGDGTGGPEPDDSSGSSSSGEPPDLCGNGNPDAGECDPDGDHACPQDCVSGSTTQVAIDTDSDTDSDTDTDTNGCEGEPIYVGMTAAVEPPWEFMGITGFGAGRMMCQSSFGKDADVCTYTNLVDAEMQGDFAAVLAGTTMWVHREVMALYMAAMVTPGPGGRCNDWLYDTNHMYDGEFVTVEAGGALTFTLDTDVNTPATSLLECAGEFRAIPCCVICE